MSPKLLLIGSTFLRYACTTLLGVVLSRFYSKSDFGTYLQAVLWIGTVAEIASLGLPKAVLYFSGVEADKKNAMLHVLGLLCLSTGLACLFTALFWDEIGGAFSNPSLQPLLGAVCANLFFKALSANLLNLSLVTGEVRASSFISLFLSPFLLVGMGLLAYAGYPVKALLWATCAIEVAQCLLFSHRTLFRKGAERALPGHFRWDFALAGRILAYSAPLVLTIFTILLGRKADSFLISTLFQPGDFALYSRGALELPFGQLIVVNVANLVMPEFARLYREKRHAEVSATLGREAFSIALPVFICFFSVLLVHEELIVFLYSARYAESARVFLFYLLLLPIQIYAFDTVLQAMHQSSKVTYSALASFAFNMGLSFFLIPRFGIVGPAIGVVGGVLFHNLLLLFFLNRLLGIRFAKALPWRRLGAALFLAGLPLLLLWPLKVLLHRTLSLPLLVPLLLLPLLEALLAAALLHRAGLLPPALVEKARAFLGRAPKPPYPSASFPGDRP